MKKLYWCILSGSLFLTGCNSDDRSEGNGPEQEKIVLLSKFTTVYYDNPSNPETIINTLQYNEKGELTDNISSEGRYSEFEYDATGKPVKVTYYKNDKSIDYSSAFTYNGSVLTNVKASYENPFFNRSYTYTYANGQLVASELCQAEDCSNASHTTYQYNGENVSEETADRSLKTKRVYQYDDNPSPFTNTNPYLRIMMEGAYTLSKNNYTSEKISYLSSDGTWIPIQEITYTIEYNAKKFPVKITGKEANGNMYVQYLYEYIEK